MDIYLFFTRILIFILQKHSLKAFEERSMRMSLSMDYEGGSANPGSRHILNCRPEMHNNLKLQLTTDNNLTCMQGILKHPRTFKKSTHIHVYADFQKAWHQGCVFSDVRL